MAVKNILVDDLDKASVATDTVPFSYRGKRYEIDLSAQNMMKFDDDMIKWIDCARVISTGLAKKPAMKKAATNGDGGDKTEFYAAVREWARANGKQVHDRGRIPGELISAYEQAMSKK